MQTWLKRVIGYSLAATAGLTLVTSLALAADNSGSSLDSIFGSTTSWGFAPSDVIMATGNTSTGVIIMAPVVTANGENILQYSVVYSIGKSISVAEPQDLLEQKITIDAASITNNTIQLQLTGLKAGTLYYFIIKPTNKDGISGDFSSEGSFTTLGSLPAPSNNPTNTPDTTTPLGAAAQTDPNFLYTITSGTTTLTWTAPSDVNTYWFSLKNINDTDYKAAGSAKATAQQFSFVVTKTGSYNVKIVGTDANGNPVGSERILNVKIDVIADVPGKGKPQTGPALNIILMSTFLMMLVYVVYKFRGAR